MSQVADCPLSPAIGGMTCRLFGIVPMPSQSFGEAGLNATNDTDRIDRRAWRGPHHPVLAAAGGAGPARPRHARDIAQCDGRIFGGNFSLAALRCRAVADWPLIASSA